MPKFRSGPTKKRRFCGNRFSSKGNADPVEVTASSSKLMSDVNKMKGFADPPENISGNRIVNMEILRNIFGILCCPDCSSVGIELKEKSKFGLNSHMMLQCNMCPFKKSFATSRKIGRSSETNARFVYGMRQIGKGAAAARKLCATLDIPPPPNNTSYKAYERKLTEATSKIAQQSMMTAAEELKNRSQITDISTPCGVSLDATWQRRGFSSLNGCVAAISIDTGKVVDVEIMSGYCQICRKLKACKDNLEAQTIKADHSCQCNHSGSAGSMEAVGAKRIFNRSEQQRSLQYKDYYGDGDSKAYEEVKNTYGPNSVTKQECIGHIQKRVGAHLRNLKKKTRGISGKGKLTDSFIDRLQNYYGIAIRSNVGNLQQMQQATIAAFFHCVSNNMKPMHGQCPVGKDSWCAFQRAKAGNEIFVHKNVGLKNELINLIKPTYMKLCDASLLKKCLKGKTQNQNESFNGVVWQRVPKTTFVCRPILTFGVNDAVVQFNDGFMGSKCILEDLGIEPGCYTTEGYRKLDRTRVGDSRRHSTPNFKKQRKILKATRKRKIVSVTKKEGPTYEAGGF